MTFSLLVHPATTPQIAAAKLSTPAILNSVLHSISAFTYHKVEISDRPKIIIR
ncbi:MAG: hypothetical protein V7K15_05595 [Nostoc sp.]